MDLQQVSHILPQSNNQNVEIVQELEEEIMELCEPIVVIEQMQDQPIIELDQAQFGFNNYIEANEEM